MARAGMDRSVAYGAGSLAVERFTVDELIVAGFDRIGCLQPVLRPPGYDEQPGWPNRRLSAGAALRERGMLTPSGEGCWQSEGPLRAVLSGRAAARATIEIVHTEGAAVRRRALVFGMLTVPPDQILVVADDRTDTEEGCCVCSVRSRLLFATELTDEICGDADDVADQPVGREDGMLWPAGDAPLRVLRLEMLRVDDPDSPPYQCRAMVFDTAEGPRLVVGARRGEIGTGWTRMASRSSIAGALAAVLAGEVPLAGPS